MKKLISKALALSLCLPILLAVVSCDDHNHIFEDEWTSDSDYHWHACGAENCEETKDKEEHDFEVKVDDEGKPYNECKVCGKKNDKVSIAPEHEHDFAEEYSHSENFHWKACKVENCFEPKDKSAHQYANPEVEYSDASITMTYVCQVCEYKKVETKKVDSQIEDATKWNETFENFELTNFSMYVYIDGVDNENTRHCMVDGDTVYYCIPRSREFYAQKNADGTYTKYVKDDGKFVMSEDADGEWFIAGSTEPVIRVSFADNFDKFTYDAQTASYTCEDSIEAKCTSFDGDQWRTMYCYNSVIRVNDGKIVHIECEYNFDLESQERSSFIYYNIGMTDFSIPQDITG